MADKIVRIKYNGSWNTLPSPGAELTADAEQIDDTILGQSWKSSWPGLLKFGISCRCFHKGVAGYNAKIRLAGSEIAARSFELTQTAEAVDVSTLPAVQANNGWAIQRCGLRTVSIRVPKFYASKAALTALQARTPVTISITPDGMNEAVAVGDFVYLGIAWNGDVGSPEEEELNFGLHVPLADSSVPFVWTTGGGSSLVTSSSTNPPDMPDAIVDLLNSFMDRANITVAYYPDGHADSSESGLIASAFVTDISLRAGVEGNVEFGCELASAGGL